MDMDNIISKIQKELENNSDKKTQESTRNFFKEEIQSYGVKTATVVKMSKDHFKSIENNSKAEIWGLCEELWRSQTLEESFIACNWSYFIHKDYQPDDFDVFEKWINNYVNNWASCDTLCNHTLGEFIEMYQEYLSRLKKMATSGNRWMRRASAVSLIIPARKGKFINDIFEIADLLLTDKDDLVQKGYGWMLKVACQEHQQEVFKYIMSKKSIMPRTALRYAIEKMPNELKKAAMVK
jgi:3-methyladenine DNA glycosylase AlkD